MALDAYFSLLNGQKEFRWHCWDYTFTLLFLRNAMGLISDLEGNTEATSTSDLLSSKEPSWVMVGAAACLPRDALWVLPSSTVILKQIFPLAYASVLVADILMQASPLPRRGPRPLAVWQECIPRRATGGFLCNGHSWRRYPCTMPTVGLAPFPARIINRASGNALHLRGVWRGSTKGRGMPNRRGAGVSAALLKTLRVWFWYRGWVRTTWTGTPLKSRNH